MSTDAVAPSRGDRPLTTKEMLASVPGLGRWRRRVFAATWIAYASYYFVREAPSVAKLGILDDPSVNHVLTSHALGVMDAIYLAAYAAGQFLWGAVADRVGPRVMVIGGMLTSIAAACVMGLSSTALVFGAAMLILGLGQSTGWAPLCKNVSSFFTVKERGRVLGLWSTNYAFGGLASVPFLGWVAYSVFDSWHAALFTGALVMAVVLLVFVVLQRNSPEAVGLPGIADAEAGRTAPAGDAPAVTAGRGAAPPKKGVRETLGDPMVRVLGAAYFLLKPARYAILLWGPVLVSERLPQVDKVSATAIPIAFGVTGCLAPSLIGWLSDKRFGSRRVPPAVLSLVALTIVLLLFMPLTATHSVTLMMLLLGAMGLTVYAADSMISCTAAVDFGTSDRAGTAAGVVNGCGSVGAILGGLLPGFVSGTALFYGFAGAALLAAVILLPRWNQVARTA
ncbi:MFS transporter [Kitasatospora sp. NBC_00240]|uniref:MFS transporter n=1 Tax=Kitasatospora sp. NBC_00240 TaxID=2903567 RepID=UPI002257B349|nr:MFS transporter [Kitasatospora sp. NBC_00240]MCX5207823.1 MFS transporter [Kitasatospora sp. NBC_00240]